MKALLLPARTNNFVDRYWAPMFHRIVRLLLSSFDTISNPSLRAMSKWVPVCTVRTLWIKILAGMCYEPRKRLQRQPTPARLFSLLAEISATLCECRNQRPNTPQCMHWLLTGVVKFALFMSLNCTFLRQCASSSSAVCCLPLSTPKQIPQNRFA